MENFVWEPGQGVDSAALKRIRRYFEKPKEPMGEAWFMGTDRRMFDELLGDINALPTKDLRPPLEEMVSGFSSFGALEEWVEWYHYLLGALIPRGHENYLESLFEYLITGFVGVYPNGVQPEPYRGFKKDVMYTLGRCIMEKRCWQGNDIVIGGVLHRSNNNPNRIWRWFDASGDLSSSLFFCLKYLPSPCIDRWFTSALRITSPHWRAQLIVWLVGAYKFLHEDNVWPADRVIQATPSISWASSHCLRSNMASNPLGAAIADKPAFIPCENRVNALQVLRAELTEDRYLEWLSSMAPYPYLEAEMAGIPSMFEQLYLTKRMH